MIGDVHGCLAELELLLGKLGYEVGRDAAGRPVGARHPSRRAIFLGDLVDRGPDTPGVLRLAMGMVAAGTALCVAGNHEAKLIRALRGRDVRRTHGLAESMAQLEMESHEFSEQAERFMDGLVGHYVLDGGSLVVAHAGLIERYQGRASGRVREFCLYGQSTGETDEYGLPVRYPWAREYRGRAVVLYGHTPVPAPEWVNNTLCLDTGCAFGGHLTALRYPERELVSVPAARIYYTPAKPFPPAATAIGSDAALAEAGRREPDVLDIGDVTGSRVIQTGYLARISMRDGQAAAALEVMSRFAIDPRWLLYLPPTMSPVATASAEPAGAEESDGAEGVVGAESVDGTGGVGRAAAAGQATGLLEHPEQAFEAYRADGVDHLVCEEKHMGSRAVLLVGRTPEATLARFGVSAPGGAVWTRTGRPFFEPELTAVLLERLRAAAARAGLFDELNTPWLLFDAELLPWNVKAGELLRRQYAAVGAAARAALPAAVAVLEQAAARGLSAPTSASASSDGAFSDGASSDGASSASASSDQALVEAALARTRARKANADDFTAAYLRYCWSTDGLSGVRVAPFQLLATEGAAYHERAHEWHLGIADRLVAADPDLVTPTRWIGVDPWDPASTAEATAWWERLTAAGGEGMVVKPAANLVRGASGIIQPGLKVRGPEYLRIIYGPDYREPANLARLRQRRLGLKRSLALREYSLGLEALDRVARGEPLWRVHECVFAVLALESEPVDPRL